jgi:hypothetical protein
MSEWVVICFSMPYLFCELTWIWEVYLVFVMECDLVYEEMEGFFPQNVEDASIDQFSKIVSQALICNHKVILSLFSSKIIQLFEVCMYTWCHEPPRQ